VKTLIVKSFIILTFVSFGSALAASKKRDVRNELSTLGGNEALVERAKLLDPENKTRIVQKRSVDRYNRVELSGIGSLVGGGDSYMNTQSVGASLQYHFTPRISLGVAYTKHYNSLTDEGHTVFESAKARQRNGEYFEVPDIDYPIQQGMAFLNVYPIYGKLNLFNMGVSQFDVYLQLGYGKIELSSGRTDTYGAGGGVGLWWSNYLTTRLEGKWQTYSDRVYTGSRRLDLAIFSASLGVML